MDKSVGDAVGVEMGRVPLRVPGFRKYLRLVAEGPKKYFIRLPALFL
jgi:hypothetical protein